MPYFNIRFWSPSFLQLVHNGFSAICGLKMEHPPFELFLRKNIDRLLCSSICGQLIQKVENMKECSKISSHHHFLDWPMLVINNQLQRIFLFYVPFFFFTYQKIMFHFSLAAKFLNWLIKVMNSKSGCIFSFTRWWRLGDVPPNATKGRWICQWHHQDFINR